MNPLKCVLKQKRNPLQDFQLNMKDVNSAMMQKKPQRPLRQLRLQNLAHLLRLQQAQQHPQDLLPRRCPSLISQLINPLTREALTYCHASGELGENKETIPNTFMIGPTLTLAVL